MTGERPVHLVPHPVRNVGVHSDGRPALALGALAQPSEVVLVRQPSKVSQMKMSSSALLFNTCSERVLALDVVHCEAVANPGGLDPRVGDGGAGLALAAQTLTRCKHRWWQYL